MVAKAATALIAAGGLAATTVVGSVISQDETPTAQVTKVVDGDTLDVTKDGQRTRVRLLNVNTPETVDPNRSPECGGVQAGQWLEKRLPVGSAVTLAYDVERQDSYGRDLAWVTAPDGGVVNLEIARQGLGEAMVVEPNRTHYAEVQAAQEEARSNETGLFDPRMECVLPAQVARQVAALDESSTAATSPGDSHMAAALAGSAAVYTALSRAEHSVHGRMLGTVGASKLRQDLDHAHSRARERSNDLEKQTRLEKQRDTAAKKAAETARRDAAAKAARHEAAKRRAEAEKRRAEAARRTSKPTEQRTPDAAVREAPRPASKPKTPPAPPKASTPRRGTTKKKTPPGPSGSGGPAGYTGPRCYAPGGKTWRPC